MIKEGILLFYRYLSVMLEYMNRIRALLSSVLQSQALCSGLVSTGNFAPPVTPTVLKPVKGLYIHVIVHMLR